MTIRELRISDIPRQLMPGRLSGPDLACPWESLAGPSSAFSLQQLVRHLVIARLKGQQVLALVEGLRVRGVAVVRSRHGTRAWELAHLYAAPSSLVRCGELLEYCSGYVAQQGGERLFLRLHPESPVQVVARRCGFFPGFLEEAYQGSRASNPLKSTVNLRLRPVAPADSHNIFRLYNSSVPAPVRSAYGLTFDQWNDAQETPRGHVTEYVWERDQELRGWVQIARKKGTLRLQAMLHPSESAIADLICHEAQRLAGYGNTVVWVVPSHQHALAWALRQNSWRVTHSYMTLIKPVAKGIKEMAMSPVHV